MMQLMVVAVRSLIDWLPCHPGKSPPNKSPPWQVTIQQVTTLARCCIQLHLMNF
ncbi:histidine-rich glycoprotein, partial [Biomphalaria glabrata]